MKKIVCALSVMFLVIGCASVQKAMLPDDVFITNGDIEEPYTPIAAIQVAKIGFKFINDLVPATLDDSLSKMLAEEARKVGADAVINVKFCSTPFPGMIFMGFTATTARGIAVERQN